MTAICALEHSRGVVVGTDSFFGSSMQCDRMDRAKLTLHRRGKFCVATAGELRVGQIIESVAPVGNRRPGEDDIAFLVRAWVERVRRAIVECDIELLRRGPPEFAAIIAWSGRAYTMTSDLGVYRSARGFASIGAGDPFTSASLESSTGSPRKRVEKALCAAAEHSPGVRGPFYVVDVPK